MKMTQSTALLFMLVAGGSAGIVAQSSSDSKYFSGADTPFAVQSKLPQEAVLYHHNLIQPVDDVRKSKYEYVQSIMKMRRAHAVEWKRQDLLKVIQKTRDFCAGSGPFYGDSTLKSELIRYLDLDNIVLKEDFGKILDMEDINAQSYDQPEAHQLAIDLAVEKLNSSFDVLKKADHDFFVKYHIIEKADTDELTRSIAKVNKAIDYYDTIFRVFFKVNKEYSYAMACVEKKDIPGLQQHTATLISLSEDGLERLKLKTGFEGDEEFLTTVIRIIEFYRHEGQVTFPANVEFTMKVDNFQKDRKQFMAIKESDRTKEDVDRFNNGVKDYNRAVKDINDLNHTSFKAQKDLINQWNRQVEKFFKKHALK